ncbi:putative NADH:ubiquinone/plastoquinone oxidoreductase, chain 3 [Medicago truncatula]|uniref:Putative NADH:ubiquinone/plastoquinone oxidoreductase, chain 3 n=1 Tax=Medicago truncatula TaxID=3880 RepID=G7L2I2_MEDTR|nr:transmembrane protein, putative [Medicago truncatula]RHN46872.1 putative NADH:ubiquinone/plastoquinone oxidoreductase, chain 3 [Medicago truncatula]
MHRSTFMFFLYKYDIFWVFLIISIVIAILAFIISEILASIRKGAEKLASRTENESSQVESLA